MRRVVRVLFDESHSQAWTIRPEVARQVQPSHPGDSSYARAAELLRSRDVAVEPHTAGPLTPEALAAADVLVLAHPSEPRWERTVPGGPPRLAPDELDAVEAFVAGGGGLLVLGEEEQDKYGNNLDALLERFGLGLDSTVVSDYERHRSAPSWVLADLQPGVTEESDVLAGVGEVCFYRATTVRPGDGRVIARASPSASSPGAPLAACVTHDAGRVVLLGDSDLFGDDCLDAPGHATLWVNLVVWAGAAAFSRPAPVAASPAVADPHWPALKAATEELRLRQEPDGSCPAGAAELVDAMAGAVAGLAPRFPHQAAYLQAVVADLHAWRDGGFGTPDFGRSLERFRPDRARRDGIEHLVVFPMYLQNASRDTRFEALVVRVPWPDWLSELERARYDNPQFVPVTFVDHTAGYDSECAVLFPETVSAAGRAPNHFGAIFCDREAARFRRVIARACELLRVNLPPEAAAMLRSEQLSTDAYLLWDLVHDRTHSHGDLPFDPFMVRQRSPYWMYALEELRCDLTAFGEAAGLECEGLALCRDVQYAILFDRLFRFPVTGPRVRNYDGLGGQLLFAYLHRHGLLQWTDNRLTIDWRRVADGVEALRAMVEELYRAGIDRSKVSHWIAAHELVATYVPPATSSRWAPGNRPLTGETDPKAWIDLVEPDEFPLSMFYLQLQEKLATARAVA
jgi:hypothetical protein